MQIKHFTCVTQLIALGVLGSVLALSPAAFAASPSVWNGGGTDDLWTNAANWNANAPVPGTSYALQFAGTTRLSSDNNFTAASNFGAITFNTGAGTFLLDGNSITSNGTITNSSTSLQTLNLDIILAGARTIATTSGDITIGGDISGGFGLTKSGANVLTLSGSNTVGNTAFSSPGGTIKLANASALGAAGNTVAMANGTTLHYGLDSAINLYNVDLGAAAGGKVANLILDRTTAGVAVDQTLSSLTIQGASTGGGETFNTNVGANVTTGTPTLFITALAGGASSRTAHIAGNATYSIGSVTGSTVGSNSSFTFAFDGTSNSNAVTGVISNNSGAFLNTTNVAVTAGAWTLSATNPYTGTTTISGGKLVVGNGSTGSIDNSAISVSAGTLTGHLATGNNIGTFLTTIGNGTGSSDAIITGGNSAANSIGRLATLGGLTLNSDASFVFDLDSTAGVADQVIVAGTTAINGAAQFTFNFAGNGAGLELSETFTAIGGAGLISGSTFGNLAQGQVFNFGAYQFTANNYTTAEDLVFTVTAVPEPSSLAMLLGGVGMILGLQRSRRGRGLVA